jgi:hypothetical protein
LGLFVQASFKSLSIFFSQFGRTNKRYGQFWYNKYEFSGDYETGPEEPELEGKQVEKKSKAAQTRPKKLTRFGQEPTNNQQPTTKDST